jgi:hypothetical protein
MGEGFACLWMEFVIQCSRVALHRLLTPSIVYLQLSRVIITRADNETESFNEIIGAGGAAEICSTQQ